MATLKNVLIVDDDRLYARIVKGMIESTYSTNDVCIAENGLGALQHMLSKKATPADLPNVILLDANMPVLDGWQFLDQLSELQKELPHEVEIYLSSANFTISEKNKLRQYKQLTGVIDKTEIQQSLNKIFA